MSNEYAEGIEAFLAGRSMHYNPYRERGTNEQWSDWLAGYIKAKWESECG